MKFTDLEKRISDIWNCAGQTPESSLHAGLKNNQVFQIQILNSALRWMTLKKGGGGGGQGEREEEFNIC